MLDTVITGGTLVDGSGAPAKRADIGIKDGRVVFAGVDGDDQAAARTVDATGLVVAPGFVDVHTHYDAQVFWDSACSPSSLHGVTTVVAGNCGFSIAPLPDDEDYLMRMLSRVEGMPLAALEAGVPWNWRSFRDYLDAVAASGTAVNFAALVGHSAVRRTVLGDRCHDPEVSSDELAAMSELVRDALEAGALGFSSSWAATHVDGAGDPVPSRAASRDELVALCSVLGPFQGTQVEFIATNGAFEELHLELMTSMALAARSPLNWNVLIPRSRAMTESRLRASDHARERGALVVALSYPDVMRTQASFLSSAFDSILGWAPIMTLPPDAKLAALADPAARAALREGAASPANRSSVRYEALTVAGTYHPSNQRYEGRRIDAIAEELGRDPLDVLCDIVVADELRTGLLPEAQAADGEAWDVRRETWNDPRVIIGASDGGAHLDILSTFDYPVRYLALARDHDELTLEGAVRQLTDIPARLYGLRDRGRLEPGGWADAVVFDPAAIDAGPVEWRTDLPAGAGRLYAQPVGMAYVLVNGTEIACDGRLTGATPGQVLRRGRDTVDGADRQAGATRHDGRGDGMIAAR